jgi:hypothetical protein
VTVARATKAASVLLPDSPIRTRAWYQIYARLARPTLDWVGVVGAAWALFIGDWIDKPMEDGTRIIVLGFAAALHGIRSFEQMKGAV